MNNSLILLWSVILLSLPAFGADLDGRSAFTPPPGRDIGAALKRAERENKRVLVFLVDPAKNQAQHLIGTMSPAETKQTVKDHFIVVLLTNPHEPHIAGQVTDVVSVHPAYFLFDKDGKILAKGDAAMGNYSIAWSKKLAEMP